MMIPAKELASVFEGILGWPYASPGSNDSRGIDCSGAFVYAYRQFGERIYHGSNRIIRKYCHDVKNVRSVSDLKIGMAIFKGRDDLSRMKAEYKRGGRYYDPALPLDYYHMGLVTSLSPLRIVNATTPVARADSDLSRWLCAGELDAVRYEEDGAAEPGGSPDVSSAEVYAPTGSTVNLRRSPSLSSVVLVRVPIGQSVSVLDASDSTWWRVRYESRTGYMMREFLRA